MSDALRTHLTTESTAALGAAFKTLTQAMTDDPEYAWSVHCNVAVPIRDELGGGLASQAIANRAAARVISHLFGVDMTQHEYFPSTQEVE